MNLKFLVNDYVLIWNVLFQASITEKIHKLKQKLWDNYKIEYNKTYYDKDYILQDYKNFIPNDDTVYNMVLETKEYERIKKDTEKYRNMLLKKWDENKRKVKAELKDILRFNVEDYKVLVVSDLMNTVDTTIIKDQKENVIVFGLKSDGTNKIIIDLLYEILKRETRNYNSKHRNIVKAVIELAILNELPTRLNKRSNYLTGSSARDNIKRQIYPYWLMYLGATKEEMLEYMMRDKIAFNIDDFTYERQLKNVDLLKFIDFCIRNKKHIIKSNDLEVI
ncbi:MAG: hypothetical protein IKG58_02320 [Bacilli bacterium]|nr:hypothetical protein [Bacilli bacterium]MBR3049377.1 hypothetical protein [Bacilli bacterium]